MLPPPPCYFCKEVYFCEQVIFGVFETFTIAKIWKATQSANTFFNSIHKNLVLSVIAHMNLSQFLAMSENLKKNITCTCKKVLVCSMSYQGKITMLWICIWMKTCCEGEITQLVTDNSNVGSEWLKWKAVINRSTERVYVVLVLLF